MARWRFVLEGTYSAANCAKRKSDFNGQEMAAWILQK